MQVVSGRKCQWELNETTVCRAAQPRFISPRLDWPGQDQNTVDLCGRRLFEDVESEAAMEANTAKKGGRSAYKLNSVGAQFRKQLHGLMGALNQCQPHYVR